MCFMWLTVSITTPAALTFCKLWSEGYCSCTRARLFSAVISGLSATEGRNESDSCCLHISIKCCSMALEDCRPCRFSDDASRSSSRAASVSLASACILCSSCACFSVSSSSELEEGLSSNAIRLALELCRPLVAFETDLRGAAMLWIPVIYSYLTHRRVFGRNLPCLLLSGYYYRYDEMNSTKCLFAHLVTINVMDLKRTRIHL